MKAVIRTSTAVLAASVITASFAITASANERYATQQSYIDSHGNVRLMGATPRDNLPATNRPFLALRTTAAPRLIAPAPDVRATHEVSAATSVAVVAKDPYDLGSRHCCRPGEPYWDYDE